GSGAPPARGRQRRLPRARSPLRLEDAPALREGRAGRRRLSPLDPAGVPHAHRPGAAPPRGLAGLALGVALQAVVWDRLPLARVIDERVPLRTDPVARVEEAPADAPDLSPIAVLAPERG